ncbi:phage tail protein [Pectobacterium carotovorum]|uniref:phage tail protein n=1 Tax=Pectobacterium carotovorum TaxID=554 RepID=UPI00057DCA99|nr:phage tail protein [Pectobacterium carotovorum]KHT35189.1 tail fiber protein [Pectobacterium carotovorum subsp. carotovorum]MBA0180248.1 tail fiber protein [Pectobacterium carotovorum]MBA0191788.1 tail fiber protein [Pectobacterium carotovorum]MBA0199213.1 tail fiber protein [Pectobacterium carotovorum]RJL41937.1 phage tail protein [Pectobacterium carotovorum]
MANLSEQESWIDGIYQLETSDPVVAGPGGISNRQAEQLASRTAYLKKMQETTGESLQKHLAASDPHSQYAPKNSPALTGTPTAPTTAQTANNTQIATTAFVKSALAALVNGSPAALDTLQELANALGNDPHFSTTVVNAIADVKTDVANKLNAHASILDAHPQYAPKASPAFTGTPTAPTAASGSNDTQLATTAFVKAAVAALVNGSPAALDTLQELATALGNDPNFSTTVLNALAGKLAKDQNGADIPDKAKFRGNMGLVKQTSVSDYTSGSVLINGAWGLGGSGIMADDANEIIQSGQSKFFRSSANKDVNINWPNSDGYAWRGINVAWDTNASSMLAFNQSNGTAPDQPRMHYRTRAGGMNSTWLNVLMSNQYTVDTNGYLKTPTSATMTSTSIGAMSINDLAGIPLPFPGAVAPAGWLKCNGQQFDKAQYPILTSRYPSGFLPDLRGEFVRGWDDGRGADAGRALLSVQGDAIRSHKHALKLSHEGGGQYDGGGFPPLDATGPFVVHSESQPDESSSSSSGAGNPMHSFGESETRPRNIAFNYIVRAA